MGYEIRHDGCSVLRAATKRDARRIGYWLAREAFLGGLTVVVTEPDRETGAVELIAAWRREAGKRPVRVEL